MNRLFLFFLSDLYKESFINKVLLTIKDFYDGSFIKKLLLKIKDHYMESYIYSIFLKDEEDFSIKFNFRLIKFSGNVESIFIFLSIFGIFFSLNIKDNLIKIISLIFLYLILYITLFDKKILKESFIYKMISGGISD